jgi:hypothetical protein
MEFEGTKDDDAIVVTGYRPARSVVAISESLLSRLRALPPEALVAGDVTVGEVRRLCTSTIETWGNAGRG